MSAARGQPAIVRALRGHSAALAFGLVVTLALAVRLAFVFRAPFLVQGDSETYLSPALALERGGGFDLTLKRTPGYPLLIAAVLGAFGEDLRTLTLVQHAVGVASAGLAYLLARRLAGPVAGLVAGLATGLAGNLLIYERLVMTETLFTMLLTAATFTLVLSASTRGWRWPLVAGLMIALATLTRPVAQPLLLLLPVALRLGGRRWRDVALGSLAALIGYGLLLVPWSVRGTLAGAGGDVGALGQTLVGRTARHDRRDVAADRGFIFYDPTIDADDPDPTRLAARKILQDAANRGSSGRAVHTRIRKELGLSEASADRLMRDLAIEAIRRRPFYYLSGTMQRFVRIWSTPAERLDASWNDQGTIRRSWEDAPSAPLLEQLAGPVNRELPYAEALAGAFQPARLGPLHGLLFVLGLAVAMWRPYRLALVPALAVLLMLGLSVALVGGVSRYRYPEDPLIFVVSAVGLVGGARLFAAVRSRRTAVNV
jgi:4-amino-4-deoxy-L-arabinose transferase-like glycosyltransferase